MVSENEIKEMFLPSVFKTSLLLLDYCSEKQGNLKKKNVYSGTHLKHIIDINTLIC